MHSLRHAFAPGCSTKSWCVLPRKGSRTRTEALSREWWQINDGPIIRLRPRKSKHGPNENPRTYRGVLRSVPPFVQMPKRGQKTRGTHSAGGSVRAQRTFNQRVRFGYRVAHCHCYCQLELQAPITEKRLNWSFFGGALAAFVGYSVLPIPPETGLTPFYLTGCQHLRRSFQSPRSRCGLGLRCGGCAREQAPDSLAPPRLSRTA